MSTELESSSPRELLLSYIKRLQTDYLPWYEKASTRQYAFWHIFSLISVIASLATLIVAAFMKTETLAPYAQSLLVLLPLIGTIASTILSQFRFRELEDLRERGRIEMEDILLSAHGLLAAATSDVACQEAFNEIRKRVKNLELSQHRADTALRAGAARQLSQSGYTDQ